MKTFTISLSGKQQPSHFSSGIKTPKVSRNGSDPLSLTAINPMD
jgi:hypothetical protein